MNDILKKYRSFWICTALAITTAAVYYQVFFYDFVNYDDNIYVYNNPHIQQGITLKSIKWAFTTNHSANWHPLTWVSLMLDWQFYDNHAGGYHLTNLIFHIINTILLFLVLKQMTNAVWQSAFVAALFALHPLHVESVAWIAERKDVLSMFFWILTMWAYAKYCFTAEASKQTPTTGAGANQKIKIQWYLLVVVFLALGLMSKPMLVTIPCVLLLLDYWPLNRFNTKRSAIYILIEKIPLFAMAAVLSFITFIFQQKGQVTTEFGQFPLKLRFYNAFISYIQYIIKMIWPAKLAFFYPHYGFNVSISLAVISVATLLFITILVLIFSKKHRYLFTGWFWYLGTLVPVIGIIQVGSQAMADRYTYLTLTGLFIIIAWGLSELIGKWKYHRIILWASSLTILAALGMQTYFQQQNWKNTITLCRHALKVTNYNFQAHFCLAGKLLEEGNIEEAVRHAEQAVKITPAYPNALVTLAIALQMSGKIDEAIQYYERALKIAPDSAIVYVNYSYALTAGGRFADAISLLLKGIQIAPENVELRINLGAVLAQTGKTDEAANEYKKALQISPNNPKLLESLGIILFGQGKTDESYKYFTDTLQFADNRPQTHYYLGKILIQKGEIDSAVSHLDEAIRLEPNWVEPMNDLAWYLAVKENIKAHNPQRAIKLSRQTCETTKFSEPQLLDTLAVAYAAAGDFEKAIEITQKGIELCKSPESKAVKDELEKRLILYKAGRPYLEK